MLHHFIINPAAGKGTQVESLKKEIQTVCETNAILYDIYVTKKPLDATEYTRKCLSDDINEIHRFYACGGDGTLNRFVNDIGDTELDNDIYYFAVGSGNDFLHDIGGSKYDKPRLINKYLKDLPTVNVNGREYRFINGIGYGIDGYCCEVGDRMRAESKKKINYTSIAIKGLLFHYHPTNATIIDDGKEHKYKKVWLAPTMNGRFYGGGMMPSPNQDRLSEHGEISVMVMHVRASSKRL